MRVESICKLHYRKTEDDAGFDVQHIPMHVAGGVGMVWGSIRNEDERIYHKETRMMGDYVDPGDSSYTKYDASLTDRSCDWLAKARDDEDQWCLYVGLLAPHHPLAVPQEFFVLDQLDALLPDKLHPRDGYIQHPWLEKMAFARVGEEGWKDDDERRIAIASYYSLTSYMDHSVGRIVEALNGSGQYDDTTIIYITDHGENLWARGLWGKMNMYEAPAAIPLIVSPAPNSGVVRRATSATTATVLDVSEAILDHFDATLPGERPDRSLYKMADADDDIERAVFSEYPAVGAVSGAFLLRKGR